MSSRDREAEVRNLRPHHEVVRSFDGAEIHYDLYRTGASSLVLVVPGFWRTRRSPPMLDFTRLLIETGYDVAVVDIRGHGESGGRFGFNQHEHHDVAAVAATVLPGYQHTAIAGFSYGAAIALTATARHALPIDGLLLISAVADFAMISPRLNLLTLHRHIAFSQALRRPRFVWRLRDGSRIRAIEEIGGVHVPICLIHVRNDWLIGHSHAEALYAAANEPKEIHLLEIPGNYHADRILRIAPTIIEPIITDFLARALR
jgi:alpha-beta hydrolase superfamily lysophospholipase